jgi:hypothetical protein
MRSHALRGTGACRAVDKTAAQAEHLGRNRLKLRPVNRIRPQRWRQKNSQEEA